MSTQPRQPAGVPVGGQFAASARTEPNVALRPPVPSARQRDELAMDRIALLLGTAEDWPTADLTGRIADELTAAGRPDVGDRDPEDFVAELDAYVAARPGSAGDVTRALDEMARTLGTSEDWSADTLDVLAAKVTQAGWPTPGELGEDEYLVRIANARAARSATFEGAQSAIVDGLASYLARHRDDLVVEMVGFTVHTEQDEDGTRSYARTITIRGAGDEDEGLDLSGTPAEGLLDDLALYSPWVDRLDEVTR